ncbi:lysylphosphatidylglycerol synthase domain-containing protein [Streptomyces sp. DSM 44915]|uniref:Lysylphosphatidylglycerol synthase domain-containing protein n=1 Tax=Streptomyces chisholmiae TaxID=3075540 RepID=A0ABU2JUD5_9ACTN|nr:lysylphosphatidylglycerol synthase domain-containing protein [Streptomyces sp. DSM 44915]MDT0268601.1 lysylphosphatidylglycerol synthase domain-containing protein [Streptomyces sp. DSM 44915]
MSPSSPSDPAAPDGHADPPAGPTRRRVPRAAWTVLALAAVLGGLLAWLAGNGAETLDAARALHPAPLAAALLATAAGALVAALAWRAALTGTGGDLPLRSCLRVCLVGQLGKYLPGSLWPAMVQAELAGRRGVPRLLVVTAFTVSLGASLSAGALVATLVVLGDGWGSGRGTTALLAALAAAFLAVLARPRLISHGLGRLLARVTGGPAERVGPGAVRRCLLLSVLGWLVTGLHVWFLAVALGAKPLPALPVTVGGLALATVVGSLVVIAPGGLGAREAVLVGVLAAVLPLPAAGVVAAASRLLTLLGECLVALAATLADRPAPRRAGVPTPEGAGP